MLQWIANRNCRASTMELPLTAERSEGTFHDKLSSILSTGVVPNALHSKAPQNIGPPGSHYARSTDCCFACFPQFVRGDGCNTIPTSHHSAPRSFGHHNMCNSTVAFIITPDCLTAILAAMVLLRLGSAPEAVCDAGADAEMSHRCSLPLEQ